MGAIRDKLAQWKKITEESITEEVLSLMREESEAIIALNHSQLLLRGEDSEGKSLGSYSNPEYEAAKKFLNPNGVVDLKLTGRFHDSWFMEADSFPVTFDATDSKRDMLINQDGYGENVFGLQKSNKDVMAQEILKPKIQNRYRQILHL